MMGEFHQPPAMRSPQLAQLEPQPAPCNDNTGTPTLLGLPFTPKSPRTTRADPPRAPQPQPEQSWESSKMCRAKEQYFCVPDKYN